MVTQVSPAAQKAAEELLRDAMAAVEPGDKTGSPVEGFQQGNGAASVLDVQSAGYVKVWNIETGDMSIVNKNMLKTQLEKKNTGETAPQLKGTFAFTTDPSKVLGRPVIGTLTCMLHMSHPDRAKHEALGFRTCKKANLRTPLDVRTHMRSKHKREWESLEDERRRVTEEEEREVRRAIIAQRAAPVVPTVVVEKPVVKAEATTKPCPKCGEQVKDNGLSLFHHNKKHAES